MFRPDPNQANRRKLEVIGNFKEPPPLGITLRDGGCDFDFNPPEEAAKSLGGRRPTEREKAARFIIDALTRQNDLIGNDLCDQWESNHGGSYKTFWRAVKDMTEAGDLATDGGTGTGKQKVLHLIGQNPPTP
jgi:hypothetical protein